MTLRGVFTRQAPNVCALARARAGDPDAFGEFYDLYRERVLRFYARRVLDPETALDLTAETFATALERRYQFRGSEVAEEQGWLFSIARSLVSRYWQRENYDRESVRRLGISTLRFEPAETERVEAMADLSQLRGPLRDALLQLSEDQRMAIELHVVGELEYREVADRLQVSEQVVRTRVSRGLRVLGGLLATDGHVTQGVE